MVSKRCQWRWTDVSSTLHFFYHARQFIHDRKSVRVLPSNARVIQYTVTDAMSDGRLGLNSVSLEKAFEGLLATTLTAPLIGRRPNAAHVSMFQALMTFWLLTWGTGQQHHPGSLSVFFVSNYRHKSNVSLAVCTAPDNSSALGLWRFIVPLTSLVFGWVLSTEENADNSFYMVADIHSASLIVAFLTSTASIVSQDLNTDLPASETLRSVLKLSEEEFARDGHAAAGLFDVLLHVGHSIIAASCLYAQYCAKSPPAGIEPSACQQPTSVYERVVVGLSNAFQYPPGVIAQVLGPIEECESSSLRNCRWFPSMHWEAREETGGAVLWPEVCEMARELEARIGPISAESHSPLSAAMTSPVEAIEPTHVSSEDNRTGISASPPSRRGPLLAAREVDRTEGESDPDAEGSSDEDLSQKDGYLEANSRRRYAGPSGLPLKRARAVTDPSLANEIQQMDASRTASERPPSKRRRRTRC